MKWLSETPFKVEGQDVFFFEEPLLTMSSRLPLNGDGDLKNCFSLSRKQGNTFHLMIQKTVLSH